MEHEIAEMERRRHEAMSRACEIPRLTRIQVVDSLGGYGSRMNGGFWQTVKMRPSELGCSRRSLRLNQVHFAPIGAFQAQRQS